MAENDLTKKGRIAYDYRLDESTNINFLKNMGFTPCKAEQPLQGMEL